MQEIEKTAGATAKRANFLRKVTHLACGAAIVLLVTAVGLLVETPLGLFAIIPLVLIPLFVCAWVYGILLCGIAECIAASTVLAARSAERGKGVGE